MFLNFLKEKKGKIISKVCFFVKFMEYILFFFLLQTILKLFKPKNLANLHFYTSNFGLYFFYLISLLNIHAYNKKHQKMFYLKKSLNIYIKKLFLNIVFGK